MNIPNLEKHVYLAIFFTFIAFNLMDTFTTHIAVVNEGTEVERNFVARAAFENGGIAFIAYMAFKHLFFPSIIAFLLYGASRAKDYGHPFKQGAVFAMGLLGPSYITLALMSTVISNIAQLGIMGLFGAVNIFT